MFKALLFGLQLLSGLLTLFMSFASSPNYKTLFWMVLPYALAHVALTAYGFAQATVWGKTGLALFTFLTLFSFVDLTSRVWLHSGLVAWLQRGFY